MLNIKGKDSAKEFQGSIEEILIDAGEKVEKNQVLLKLVDIEFVTQQKMNDEQYYGIVEIRQLSFEAKLENPNFLKI